jgi:hypothetical protein
MREFFLWILDPASLSDSKNSHCRQSYEFMQQLFPVFYDIFFDLFEIKAKERI